MHFGRKFILFAVLILNMSLRSQVILTEVMYRPDTDVAYTEFVEIYNLSDTAISLDGWKIGDSLAQDNIIDAGEGLVLEPHQYGLILDAGYFENSTIYDSLIPTEALLLTIDAGSFGRRGFSNSVAEPVILINPAGDTVQVYKYSLGNDPGFSDEKIFLTADNSPEIWANSRMFRGTPGFENSVFKQPIDLSITGFEVFRDSSTTGNNFAFRFVVLNVGLESVQTFAWKAFLDLNGNSLPDNPEVREENRFNGNLLPGDSLQIEGKFQDVPSGEVVFGIFIEHPLDNNLENNIRLVSKYIPPAEIGVCINEIMAQPLSGQSEWIELFNYGDFPLNLKYLFFTDGKDTARFTIDSQEFLPETYLLLGKDSTLLQLYPSISNQIFISSGFPTLNNDFDNLTLFLTDGTVVDRVRYTSSWYGREVESGVSLEKINPRLNGNISSNWSASVSATGSTPGYRNSIWVESLPEAASLQIYPNPFSPDNDGFEDFTIISFQVPVETAFARIRLFDIRGRLIRTLVSNQPVAHTARFIWDGKDDTGRVARIGAYICFLEVLNSDKQVFQQLKKTVILYKK